MLQGFAGVNQFQSTCPLRGTTAHTLSSSFRRRFQSTCPLRGTTWTVPVEMMCLHRFQSTCPLRGTTAAASPTLPPPSYFNPRAPCGARLVVQLANRRQMHFNPRAPCGARPYTPAIPPETNNFNPRAPCGARRDMRARTFANEEISIHVPLAGHDVAICSQPSQLLHFNPRAPCGARRVSVGAPPPDRHFNPRAPCGARPDR